MTTQEQVKAAVQLEVQSLALFDGAKYRDALTSWLQAADAWAALAADVGPARRWSCLARCQFAFRNAAVTSDLLADSIGGHQERETPAERRRH